MLTCAYREGVGETVAMEGVMVDGEKRQVKDGFMYRYLGKRLEEGHPTYVPAAANASGSTPFMYRVEEKAEEKGEEKVEEKGEKRRIVSQRQMNLFAVDPGDVSPIL